MTTVTTEAIAGVADLKAGYTLGHADVAILKTLAAELLAVREAQPVWVDAEIHETIEDILHRRMSGAGRYVSFHRNQSPTGFKQRMPIYTAPPAPALPGELLDAMAEVIRISDRDHEAWDRAKAAISACRAAMLQPVSQGCAWTYDEHDYKWDSTCGESWQFTDGGPEDNGVKFCQGCGKPVALAAAPTPTKAVPDA